jgi:hypothetical protein
MMDTVISWAGAHPLMALGLMAAVGLLIGALTIGPHVSEAVHRDHPRC